MKRYTLKFTLQDSTLSSDELREAVEEVLLRLHPRITYKIRQVKAGGSGQMMAEIAVDGKRDLLESAFRAQEWKVPVRLESMGWGWMTNDGSKISTEPGSSLFELDPLAAVRPMEGNGEFQLNKKPGRLRYMIMIISTMGMVFLLIANGVHSHSLILQIAYIIGFSVWLFSLNEMPLDVRVYAEKVIFTNEGLAVKYWLRKQPARLAWEEIWGLEYTEPVCVVFKSGGKNRVLLSERFGCKEQKVVLKTIVERAGLYFVEGNFRNLLYRRYDSK